MADLSYRKRAGGYGKGSPLYVGPKAYKCCWGNFAVRVDDNRVLISPSLMSERHFCEMRPEDFYSLITR